MRYLTFALAKGRLANKSLDLFEKIGITCEEMKDKDTRKLIFTNEELGYRFFLAKANDVPTYVEYGSRYRHCRKRYDPGRGTKALRGAGLKTGQMPHVCVRSGIGPGAATAP